MIQRKLLKMKHQKASMRLAGRCDPMNQAANNVTAIAGH